MHKKLGLRTTRKLKTRKAIAKRRINIKTLFKVVKRNAYS